MESDYKIPTVLKITTGKLSSKKISSFKLLITFPTSILEGIASIIS